MQNGPFLRQALLGGVILIQSFTWAAAGDPAVPEPTLSRVPWETSRVIGSPEPPLEYKTQQVFTELELKHPLYIAVLPGTDRVLIVEQAGKILSVPNVPEAKEAEVFLKLDDHDTYSFCFHPRFAANRYVYVFANGPNSEKKHKNNRILRYEVAPQAPFACQAETQTAIIEWPSNGHNGGEMAFGLDGMLYISSGDGTSDSDTDMTGQDIRDLTSGVIRIDVEHPTADKLYTIPADNPFWNIPDARPELWAYGFRNPWRLCFDARTGDLWVGDIGQDLWEMIHVVQRGANHGWSVMEGSQPFHPLRPRGPTPISPPTIEHHHWESRSITGGLVYYGRKFPDLVGAYLYGDYSTGKIWGARYRDGKITWRRELADTTLQILGFGEDAAGEVLIVDYAGQIHRLIPAPPPERAPEDFPRKLSETGLFTSVPEHRPHPAIVSYSVNSPLWSDGAFKERFIALPGLGTIEHQDKGAWKFPEGTVLVKSFSLERKAGDPTTRERIETRLLTLQQNEWVGYSYRWNAEQTDAVLVGPAGEDREFAITDSSTAEGTRKQVWRYPSRAECMVCHSRAAGFVLGPQTLQMNRDHDYGAFRDNQLAVLARSGFLRFGGKQAMPKKAEEYPRLVDPYDASSVLAARARSYLHANCAICHVPAGGGNAAIDLHYNTEADKQRYLGVVPLHDKFGIAEALLIAPGEPDRSVLLHRVGKSGRGRMPPLASSVVDEQAVQLLRAWIEGLNPSHATADDAN
jgi:uncharacterized repeat protein (TIGR03806 family)